MPTKKKQHTAVLGLTLLAMLLCLWGAIITGHPLAYLGAITLAVALVVADTRKQRRRIERERQAVDRPRVGE